MSEENEDPPKRMVGRRRRRAEQQKARGSHPARGGITDAFLPGDTPPASYKTPKRYGVGDGADGIDDLLEQRPQVM